jgi:Cys-rich protein (TIGR01571 family)
MQPEQPQVMMVPQPQVMMMAPQPQVILMQNTPAKKEPKTGWHTGLYECGNDVPVCLFSFCCTPCAYGMLVEMNLEDKADASPPCGNFGACCTVFCLQAYCPCVVCFVTSQNRGQIRTKHNLKVEPCDDLIVHCCCQCCAIAQECRELKIKYGAGGPDEIDR